jgi:arabinogalactan oligomer/maltooligosaccharide transport system substrate-binding protein
MASLPAAASYEVEFTPVPTAQVVDTLGIVLSGAPEQLDVFVGPLDVVRHFKDRLAPIEVGGGNLGMLEIGREMLSSEGELLGLPVYVEAVALLYNRAQVSDPPTTWDDVESSCQELASVGSCVGIGGGETGGSMGPSGNPVALESSYYNQVFVSAHGGLIYAYDPVSGHDLTDVTLNTPEVLEGITGLAELVSAGVIGPIDAGEAKRLFLQGAQPYWISGPWEIGELANTGIEYGVVKIPSLSGSSPAPFVHGQGFFVNGSSPNQAAAQSFLVDVLAQPEVSTALFESLNRPPASTALVESLGSQDSMGVFAAAASDGIPIPVFQAVQPPAVGLEPSFYDVWNPIGEILGRIRVGELTGSNAISAEVDALCQNLAEDYADAEASGRSLTQLPRCR